MAAPDLRGGICGLCQLPAHPLGQCRDRAGPRPHRELLPRQTEHPGAVRVALREHGRVARRGGPADAGRRRQRRRGGGGGGAPRLPHLPRAGRAAAITPGLGVADAGPVAALAQAGQVGADLTTAGDWGETQPA
ncbi:protein of unknown function [Methylorubrum extorquens]|uniref:Uncharacterized protein n=1 Tax=Methylorubrum extorquens TaxID=408 RepID=A0A2N9AJ32_METEX|nr:protein of unknown function [Methylorubrum extorquens]